jgi:excisionase family DNA binding protein
MDWSVRTISRNLDCSEVTVRRWISAGALPCFRPGGRMIRVTDADCKKFKASRSLA